MAILWIQIMEKPPGIDQFLGVTWTSAVICELILTILTILTIYIHFFSYKYIHICSYTLLDVLMQLYNPK